MKLRMNESSIRIRISPEELQQLNESLHAESTTEIYSDDGLTRQGHITYGVTIAPNGQQAHCTIEPNAITIHITQNDLDELNKPKAQGVYLRRETTAPDKTEHRFSAYVELDRPVKRKSREDTWLQGEDNKT